jgi:hypothetical protein
VRELLGRLRHFCGANSERKLAIIGHSFGGLIVFTAIAQSMIEAAALGDPTWSFADLVLLVNPAFEAARYLPIHELVELRTDGHSFEACRRPLLVTVTAENDSATGFWFPLGRRISTLKGRARGREKEALLNTPGHVQWMRTHRLDAPDPAPVSGRRLIGTISRELQERAARFNASRESGKTLSFPGGAVLTHTAYDPNNPFWMVAASPTIINGHDDIWSNAFFDFALNVLAHSLADGFVLE